MFTLIHHFSIPDIFTWGNRDIEKREEIRRVALKDFPRGPFGYEWYGFRIRVRRKESRRDLDLENVLKLIVDAFSRRMVVKDDSESREIKICDNDDLRWVRTIEIGGDFTQE